MKYNKEQLALINNKNPKVLVAANCGTGKTASLIGAVVQYRKEHLEERIDVITFTRAATSELRDKLALQHIYDVNISTIHVWSREHLKRLGDLYHFTVKILQEAEIKEILKGLIAKNTTKVKLEILYNVIMGNRKVEVSDNYMRAIDSLCRKYIKYKRANDLYDFTDYPLYLYNKLKQYGEKIYSTDALFVDELQDIDEEQYVLFELVEANKKFYIGDSKQAIYGFRGSCADIFEKFKDFDKETLINNYRSFQEIINYASTMYKYMENHLGSNNLIVSTVDYAEESDIVCMRGDGANVYVTNLFDITKDIINNVEVNTFKTATAFLKTKPMILCRTNKEVAAIQDLGWSDVSTIHQAKGLEYQNVILLDMGIKDKEDINIAYVGATRAEDNLMVIGFQQLFPIISKYQRDSLIIY